MTVFKRKNNVRVAIVSHDVHQRMNFGNEKYLVGIHALSWIRGVKSIIYGELHFYCVRVAYHQRSSVVFWLVNSYDVNVVITS
jgi:hypothetical protein